MNFCVYATDSGNKKLTKITLAISPVSVRAGVRVKIIAR